MTHRLARIARLAAKRPDVVTVAVVQRDAAAVRAGDVLRQVAEARGK